MPDRNDETVSPGNEGATPPPAGPTGGETIGAPASDPPMPLVTSIGAYRVLDVLGHGGMGIVYRAEQASPRRLVALKVIGASFVTTELLRRFELEAQTLGRLRHNGIAQIYEAGTATDAHDHPIAFFAMELIEGGLPLDEYVARAKLDIPARLRLLCAICDAVQHAHQQGVIHRDLKPDNILITPDGQPKILDFGVARVTDRDVRATMQTTHGQIIGTLPYMSPEQAGGDPDAIDTRADIYALGAIGYELLAGRRPLTLEKRLLVEAVRVIREEEPARLSSVNRTFRGDVETIIGKALAKEKERRYASANDLAADVRHYLSDEPIMARPPSTWYQIAKFSRRHRAMVGALGALLVVLVAGVIASSMFAVEANRQRRNADDNAARVRVALGEAQTQRTLAERKAADARAVLGFLGDDVFGRATPSAIPDKAVRDVIVSTMLRGAIDGVDAKFADAPLVRATAQAALGSALAALGMKQEAETLLRKSLEERQRLLGPDDADTRTSAFEHAKVLLDLGRTPEATAALRDIVARSETLAGPTAVQTLQAMGALAWALAESGATKEAEALFTRRINRAVEAARPGGMETTFARRDYATFMMQIGRSREAATVLKDVLDELVKERGPDDLDTISALKEYAGALEELGDFKTAAPLTQEVYDRRRRILGDDSSQTITALNAVAQNAAGRGDAVNALAMDRDALERSRRVHGDAHPDTLVLMNNVGDLLSKLGQLEEAAAIQGECVEVARKLLGEKNANTLTFMSNRAVTLCRLKRTDEALPIMKTVLDNRREVLGANHPDIIISTANYARVLSLTGRQAEAEPLFEECLKQADAHPDLGPKHPVTQQLAKMLAGNLDELDRTAEAVAVMKRYGIEVPPATEPATTRTTTAPTTQPS